MNSAREFVFDLTPLSLNNGIGYLVNFGQLIHKYFCAGYISRCSL